jgi:hypothetical protein
MIRNFFILPCYKRQFISLEINLSTLFDKPKFFRKKMSEIKYSR